MKRPDKTIPMWARAGHKKPITRRELLTSGVMSFSGAMMMPSILNLLIPSEARAQTASLAPFVTVNLAGGAGMSANYVVQDAGGQNLPSYSVMGLGAGASLPTPELEFGTVPFAGKVNGRVTSQFLQGVRDAGGTALTKTCFVAICGATRDDYSHNELAVDGLLSKAGLAGSLMPGIGTFRGTSGIGQDCALMNPPSPLIVSSTDAISGAIAYSTSVQASFTNANQRIGLARAISRLSEVQTRKLASITSSADLKPLIDGLNSRNQNLQKLGTSLIDPHADKANGAALDKIWGGITDATSKTDQGRVFSMMAYNAINGQCGSVGLNMGGYDYHDNTRSTGDMADYNAGQTVGRTLATAELLGKPVFIYVCTDGAVISQNSTAIDSPWTSDGGNVRGIAYTLYYNPNGRNATSGHQVGAYTSGQIVDPTTPVGNSPKAVGAAVFANYLAVQGQLGLFNTISGSFFSSTDLKTVVKMTTDLASKA